MVSVIRRSAVLALMLSASPFCKFLCRAEEPARPLPESFLSFWNQPSFQQRLAESYLAETDIEPRLTAEERERLLKILNLISSDKMNEAASAIQKELARNAAASAVFDFTLANIYFQQENLNQAAAAYRQAVQKFPKFRRAWRNLGLICIRNSDFAGAADAFTKVIELGGSDAVTYGLLGFAYASLEDHLAAESSYRMAVLLDPATMDWKMGLARSLFRQERYPEAAALCESLLRKFPDRADLWLLLANASLGMNKPLKAAEIFEWLDTLGRSTAESLLLLGDIYINEELYESAVRAYTRALEQKLSVPAERLLRASRALMTRGALAESRQLLEQMQQAFEGQFPDSLKVEMLKLQARIAVAEGAGSEEQVRLLEEIIAIDPLDGEALILLGQHWGKMQNTEKAVFYFERAAAIERYEAQARIRHAQLLVQQGKYEEALPLLRRAQQIDPRDNVREYLEQVERAAKTR